MFIEIIEAISLNRPIVVFGCGNNGRKIVNSLKKLSYDNIFFADNDVCKQNKKVDEIMVLSPDEACIMKESLFVITVFVALDEIRYQLKSKGIEDCNIVIFDSCYEKRLDLLEKKIEKRIPKKQLEFLTVDLAEHCNLNCQSCDHFSPLANEKYADLKEFNNDIVRLAKLFGEDGHMIKELCLEGGEPLLNKDIVKFVKIAREVLPKTKINIFTNGLLLLNQSEKFWQIIKECAVNLEVTKYPINFNYDGVEELANRYNVKFHYFAGGKTLKESMYKPIDLSGNNDKYDSFQKCYMGNGMCTMLKHGKIYPCTVVPNIPIFNDYFSQKIEICEKDSIDIYSVKSAEEIMDFLANPIPACTYCQPDKWTDGHKWATTKYKMSEWAE